MGCVLSSDGNYFHAKKTFALNVYLKELTRLSMTTSLVLTFSWHCWCSYCLSTVMFLDLLPVGWFITTSNHWHKSTVICNPNNCVTLMTKGAVIDKYGTEHKKHLRWSNLVTNLDWQRKHQELSMVLMCPNSSAGPQ